MWQATGHGTNDVAANRPDGSEVDYLTSECLRVLVQKRPEGPMGNQSYRYE